MTIPSPSSLHFRYGRDAVPESIYPSMDDFYRDLGETYRKAVRAFADAGCRYLQLDEVNLAYLCDPALREQVSDARRGSGDAAGDLCRHDQCGDLRHSGRHDHHHASVPRQFPLHLRRLAAATSRSPRCCSTRINVHGYFMEYDSERAGGFEPLRFVPKGKTVVLGLVTSQDRHAGKPATTSSAASRRRRNSSISTSSACRRNAASPRPRKAMCWPRTSNGRSCA